MRWIAEQFLRIQVAFAQGGGQNPSGGGTNPSGDSVRIDNPLGSGVNSFADLLYRFWYWAVILGAPVTAAVVLYAGFQMLGAQGKPEGFIKAKNTLLYAVIGYAVILISGGVPLIIKDVLTTNPPAQPQVQNLPNSAGNQPANNTEDPFGGDLRDRPGR